MSRKKAGWLACVFIVSAGFNIVMQVTLFSLAHEFDHSPPSELIQYLLFSAWVFFGPIIVLIGQIDSIISVSDCWYYIGSIINSALWAGVVIFICSKIKLFKALFDKLVQ